MQAQNIYCERKYVCSTNRTNDKKCILFVVGFYSLCIYIKKRYNFTDFNIKCVFFSSHFLYAVFLLLMLFGIVLCRIHRILLTLLRAILKNRMDSTQIGCQLIMHRFVFRFIVFFCCCVLHLYSTATAMLTSTLKSYAAIWFNCFGFTDFNESPLLATLKSSATHTQKSIRNERRL